MEDAMFVRPPNLELLMFKAEQLLRRNQKFVECYAAKMGDNWDNKIQFNFSVDVFLQLWGSTALGFDLTSDGSPAIGGSAMTEAYTTVVHERTLDFYVVFFGNEVCYTVDEANAQFLSDLQYHNVRGLSDAKNLY